MQQNKKELKRKRLKQNTKKLKQDNKKLKKEINKEISEATGITERLVLYSTREYKKTRVRYFVPDYDDYLDAEQPDAVITA